MFEGIPMTSNGVLVDILARYPNDFYGEAQDFKEEIAELSRGGRRRPEAGEAPTAWSAPLAALRGGRVRPGAPGRHDPDER